MKSFFREFKLYCLSCPYALICVTEDFYPKIKAIKAYRTETGASLKDAKHYVESKMPCEPRAGRYPWQQP